VFACTWLGNGVAVSLCLAVDGEGAEEELAFWRWRERDESAKFEGCYDW